MRLHPILIDAGVDAHMHVGMLKMYGQYILVFYSDELTSLQVQSLKSNQRFEKVWFDISTNLFAVVNWN